MSIDFKALAAPFHPDDLEWRVQSCGEKNGRIWALVLTYITSRAIQDRLDAVVGHGNWKNEFTTGPSGGVLCGISIRVDGEWIAKFDAAENTDIESVKGGVSAAMKRAAVQWGIGRYLYKLEENFAIVSEGGRFRGKPRRGRPFGGIPLHCLRGRSQRERQAMRVPARPRSPIRTTTRAWNWTKTCRSRFRSRALFSSETFRCARNAAVGCGTTEMTSARRSIPISSVETGSAGKRSGSNRRARRR